MIEVRFWFSTEALVDAKHMNSLCQNRATKKKIHVAGCLLKIILQVKKEKKNLEYYIKSLKKSQQVKLDE